VNFSDKALVQHSGPLAERRKFHKALYVSKQTVNRGRKIVKDMGLMFPE